MLLKIHFDYCFSLKLIIKELKKFTLRDLFEKLSLSDELFAQWLKEIGLLHTQRICGKAMRYKWTKNRVNPKWQCTSAKKIFMIFSKISNFFFKFSKFFFSKFQNFFFKIPKFCGFVDPTSGQHTQTIESTWQKFKAGHKSRYGTARSVFASYLYDFLWRRQFDGPDVYFHFWSQIAELYPVYS